MSIKTYCDFGKLLDKVREEYDYVCERNEKLTKQVQEWNKSEEIHRLEQMVEYYRGHALHQLSDKEAKAVSEFRKKHYESCKNSGTYRFELAGTGIGEVISIICPVCGQEENVTDYDSW